MTRINVGTVEILRERIYSRSGKLGPNDEILDPVLVETGLWPVYLDDDGSVYWEMTGTPVHRVSDFISLGDGMFMTGAVDKPTGEGEVIFKSLRFASIHEFRDFVKTDPTTRPGVEQRLVFDVTFPAGAV